MKFPQIIKSNYSYFLISFIYSAILCAGIGNYTPRFHDILLVWMVFNCIWLKPIIFKICFIPLFILVLYFPVGIQYGYPNVGLIASLYETNKSEVFEFFDIRTIVYFIIGLTLFFISISVSSKVKPTKKQINFFKVFGILLIILFLVSIVSSNLRYSRILSFFTYSHQLHQTYLHDAKEMQSLKDTDDQWGVTEVNQKYKNYIFIMGESAQKDYMSAYGYPVETTPFLDQVNGVKYNNFIAPAAYTTLSIPRMLTLPTIDGIQYQNSIVSLANKVGMQTYWLSNQSRLGEFESAVSFIAAKSKHSFFTEQENVEDHYDDNLLPELNRILSEPLDGNRFIFIHLMGSHSEFCSRIDKAKEYFEFEDDRLSCYLSTILQTDQLLKNIYDMLASKQHTFSLIYTSDHGLTIDKLKHGVTKESLKVPFFMINSDMSVQAEKDVYIGGTDLIWLLMDWIGVKVNNVEVKPHIDYEQLNDKSIVIYDDGYKAYHQIPTTVGSKVLLPNEIGGN